MNIFWSSNVQVFFFLFNHNPSTSTLGCSGCSFQLYVGFLVSSSEREDKSSSFIPRQRKLRQAGPVLAAFTSIVLLVTRIPSASARSKGVFACSYFRLDIEEKDSLDSQKYHSLHLGCSLCFRKSKIIYYLIHQCATSPLPRLGPTSERWKRWAAARCAVNF